METYNGQHSPNPSMQRARTNRVQRVDVAEPLAGALLGSHGTPSETNRFLTEESATSMAPPFILTIEGGIVYHNGGEPVLKAGA